LGVINQATRSNSSSDMFVLQILTAFRSHSIFTATTLQQHDTAQGTQAPPVNAHIYTYNPQITQPTGKKDNSLHFVMHFFFKTFRKPFHFSSSNSNK
jgi:hypothetical protein